MVEAVLEARGFAYGLLAQVFLTEPAPVLIRYLAENEAVRMFPYADRPGLLQEGAAEAAAYLSDPASLTEAALDRLRGDYTRLFLGPARLPAPPYESAYRTADRLLFQTQTLEVRQAYRKYGLITSKPGTEPDDHMGLELQFMYETCRLAAEATRPEDVEAILRDQREFLDQHLLRWAGNFAADVADSSQTGFYRGMARLLAGFLPLDRRLLDELLREGVGALSLSN